VSKLYKPIVQYDTLVTVGADNDHSSPIRVRSQQWFTWLADHQGFIYKGESGHFTARREMRGGSGYWYAYRRRKGKLTKTYLGKSEELTEERLKQASAILAGEYLSQDFVSNRGSVIFGEIATSQPLEMLPAAETSEGTPLSILTKVKPPALPAGLIARPQLIQRINTPVTILCAPSGFGKTTLLNEWRQSCGMQVAWANLDADDNHPLRFWSTVVAAFQRVNPNLGQGWFSQLRDSSPSTLYKIVVNLTNDIIRYSEDPNNSPWIGLVLDNYHLIRCSAIHTTLQTWLEHMPPTLKLVLASQTKPPLLLGYLKAKGMVLELGVNDLRFSPEEGIEYLKRHTHGKKIALSEMQRLVKRAEGWITGLVLATCALNQQEDRSEFVETFTGAHTLVRDFLLESVLSQQQPELQTFLIKTSILENLNAPLCDAVTGKTNGTETLAHLWEEKLFIDQLELPDWYRYHRLFAEMLQFQLQLQFPAEIRSLHRKAAKWYQERDASADAIFHLLASEDWEEAASLIESVALNEYEQRGEDWRLLRWLQRLPESVLQQHHPLLEVYIRLSRLVLSPKEVDHLLARLHVNVIPALSLRETVDFLDSQHRSERIQDLWMPDKQVGIKSQSTREQENVGQLLDGILQYHRNSRGDLLKAEVMAHEVYEAARVRGHPFTIFMAGGACANLAFSQGHLRRSEQIAHKVLQQTMELREKLPETASMALTALSSIHYERNQSRQADQYLDYAIEVDPYPINADVSITMAIQRAKIQSIQGDSDNALTTIEAIREFNSHHHSSIWLDQDLAAYQALFSLHQGDLTSAEKFLDRGWEIDEHPFSAFVRASILIEQNRNIAAEEIFRYLLNQYPHGFYWVPILRAKVMLSVALFKQKKINQARKVIADAARFAAPEFFVRPFIHSDPQFPLLLSLVLHTESINRGTRTFLKETLSGLEHGERAREISSKGEPSPLILAASLTPREQEILHSLDIGLSNREIAARYSISDSTVKTHLEHIYRKLGVNSRLQAITQGRLLNLL